MASGRFLKPMSRRGFLTVGTIGLGGLTLADVLRLQARADQKNYAAIAAKADSVIHIFLPGGIAHQETFDPKPFAPIEYRGDMGSIATKIDGEKFSETLPQTAQIADKLTVIRSMTHGEAAHERGTHNMFTGYRPSPALQYPEHGQRGLPRVRPAEQPAAVRLHSQPAERLRRHGLPELVVLAVQPGQRSGRPGLPGAGPEPARRDRRVAVHDAGGPCSKRSTTTSPSSEKSDNIAAMDTFYQRAYSLISSQKAREAFNIDAEPAKIRDEYGRNAAGQRMLMARRLVAAGVRFVTVDLRRLGHAHPDRRRDERPDARLRPGVRRLIRDLDRTGLLNRTLVMVSSEFGRTPKINKDAGRDHWPKVFSVVLAGGGIKRGLDLRLLERHGQRARERPDRPRRPGHHRLPPARHRRRQGADGARQPAHRDRRRRQGRQGIAGLRSSRVCSDRRLSSAGLRRCSTLARQSVERLSSPAGNCTISPDRDLALIIRVVCIALLVIARPAVVTRPRRRSARSARWAASAAPRSRSRSPARGWATPRRSSTTSRGSRRSRSRRSTTTTSRPRSRSRPTARSGCTTCGSGRRPASASCAPSASAP